MKKIFFKKCLSMVLSTITAVSFMAISASADTSVNCRTYCGGVLCRGELRFDGVNKAIVEGYITDDPTSNKLLIDVFLDVKYQMPGDPIYYVYTTKNDSSSYGGIHVSNVPIENGTFSEAKATIKFTVNEYSTGTINLGPVRSR